MRVKALKLFNDLEAKKLRKIGAEFEATSERAEQINSTSHGALVSVIEESKKIKLVHEKKNRKRTV